MADIIFGLPFELNEIDFLIDLIADICQGSKTPNFVIKLGHKCTIMLSYEFNENLPLYVLGEGSSVRRTHHIFFERNQLFADIEACLRD